MSVEERLARIEKMVAELLERLRILEDIVSASGMEARIAVDLALAFAKPAHEALRISRIVVENLARLNPGESDELAKAIIEALAVNGSMSLRELEREVRRIRGRASRSRIRSKLEELESTGVVVLERRGRRLVIRLASE